MKKVLEFKTISPFYEMCEEGTKPFDIRLWDAFDKRFRALSQYGWGIQRAWHWVIRFTNPATGRSFERGLKYWEYIRDENGELIKPTWIIMYLEVPAQRE